METVSISTQPSTRFSPKFGPTFKSHAAVNTHSIVHYLICCLDTSNSKSIPEADNIAQLNIANLQIKLFPKATIKMQHK